MEGLRDNLGGFMAGTQSTPSHSQASQGETPSPLCNHLLEQARLRFEGTLSADDLKSAVSASLSSLGDARDQTIAGLEKGEAKDEVLEAFEKSFDDMQIALEETTTFADDPSKEAHEHVREVIFHAAASTTRAIVVMQQAQLSEGPTDMPLFNGLFKMKEGYLQGGVEAKQLKAALNNIVDMTKAAIEELLASEGEQPPQRDGLVRAYKDQIVSLERVEETIATGSKDKSQVDEVFEELLKTSTGVREAMASLNEALMSKGPCRLTRTNIFLASSETFRTGGIGPDAFADIIEEFEAELRDERATVDELVGMATPSEAILAEIEGVQEAYDLHEEAMAIFSEILEGESENGDFAKAQKLLIEASEKLYDHKQELERLGESEGKVACLRCGVFNDPGNRVCTKCGAQIPQQAGASGISSTMSFQEADGGAALGTGELVMTSNLERLFGAVNEIAEDRCSDRDFVGVLHWMDGLVAEAMGAMPDIPAMAYPEATEEQVEQISDLQTKLGEQRAAMLDGMATIRDALTHMETFVEDRNKDTLIHGVRAVRDGAVRMQSAEEALKTLAEVLQKTAADAQAKREEGSEGNEE